MINKYLKIVLFIFLFSAVSLKSYGQEEEETQIQELTLGDAKTYALQNNYNIKNAKTDIAIAEKVVWETTAIGLPQVSASVEYQHFLDVATQMMPDFISPAVIGVNQSVFGLSPTVPLDTTPQMFPVQFGAKHSATFGITVSQLIFSGEYIVGLQASRIYKKVSEQTLEKTEEDVKEAITQSYYIALVAKESRQILDSTLINLTKTREETYQLYKTGFVDETTVDQLDYNIGTVRNSLQSMENQVVLTEKLLKLQMGMDLDQLIKLTDDLETAVNETDMSSSDEFSVSQNKQFQMMETQEELMTLSYKREFSTVLPTLSAFFSYSKNAQRNEFNFFDTDKDWYPTTVVGVRLDIPIFSSGSRHVKIQQAKMELSKAQTSKKMVEQSVSLEYIKSSNTLQVSKNKYDSEIRNKALALKIYDNTLKKYQNGTASSMDLTNAHNQYLKALGDYFSAVVEVLNARVALDKTMGNL